MTNSAKEDEKDGDVDFKITIAPNATVVEGETEGAESVEELPVKETDKIKSKYNSARYYRAKIAEIKDKGEEKTVRHTYNWDRLKDGINTFSEFLTKWNDGDIKSDDGSSEHNLYNPNNLKYAIDGDSFVLRYNYGPDGLEDNELENFEVRIKISEVAENTIEHQVTGHNISLKEPGSRGNTNSAGTMTNDSVSSEGLNSAHLLADWFRGSGYRRGLNLILTSDTFNKDVMYGAEKQVFNAIEAIEERNEDVFITFDLKVKALYEVTKKDGILDTLRSMRDNEEVDLESIHKKLSGGQDPSRCIEVTYDVLEVKGNNVIINHNIDIKPIGPDEFLDKTIYNE